MATDPDREGEAIAWHVSELLKAKRNLKKIPMQRVVFYEITQNAVREAVDNPREISIPLVNAQQARRALDYLVGFNLSPLLWRKIRPGLSAGRVRMTLEEQALCFMAGANSIFAGDKLLTTPNPGYVQDQEMFQTLQLKPRQAFK